MSNSLKNRIFKKFKSDTESYLAGLEIKNSLSKVCAGCGKEYDPSEFGASIRYCTVKCKHTKGGTQDVRKVCGRPPRFPRIESSAVVSMIVDDLNKRGLTAVTRTCPADPNRVLVYHAQGNEAFKVGIGGQQARERWAHVILFLRGSAHTKLVAKNPCAKSKSSEFSTRDDGFGTQKRFIRIPCYKKTCAVCEGFKHFYAILSNCSEKDAAYKLA